MWELAWRELVFGGTAAVEEAQVHEVLLSKEDEVEEEGLMTEMMTGKMEKVRGLRWWTLTRYHGRQRQKRGMSGWRKHYNFWRPGNFQPGNPRRSGSLYERPDDSLPPTASCGENRRAVNTKRYLGQTGD